MSKLTLYGLKNCDTCKKALKALEAAGQDIDFTDIRAEADLTKKVPSWIDAAGLDQILNKRSTTWRGLSETEQADALSGQAKALLIANPTLIKRPVIESGKDVYIGWTKDVQNELL